ncbi:putative protease Do-like 14 isoform X2 [Apium graveolens]|uniref:putative protease Do-like 14 isoform X2 n=1 Tax=Apium graveolens TaxID=4045 RepID=UPI003D7BD6EF
MACGIPDVGGVYDRNMRELYRENDEFADFLDFTSKIAAFKVSSSVVNVISHNKPDDTIGKTRMRSASSRTGPFGYWVKYFRGSGIIIQCHKSPNDEATFISIVLTHANLFVRKKCAPIPPSEIEVDVALSNGKLCKCEVVACDFHYNLAALRIITDTPLQPANMTSLDNSLSIHPTQPLPLDRDGLSPHPNLFKILPDDKVIVLSRVMNDPRCFFINVGHFSLKHPSINCNELLCVKGINGNNCNGGPVINYSGEMIGIMFHDSSFLPSNIISRWWKHYKTYREFRRPWIGFSVANLYTAETGFLEQLIRKFPSFSTGVLVVQVEEDSPAYHSGICDFDVIVEINGVVVQSTLEFFEKTWDKVGESVELKVLRESTGGQLNISTAIGEVTPEKFPNWVMRYRELLSHK